MNALLDVRERVRERRTTAKATRRRDRFGVRDLLGEAAAGIGARPGRLILTILGTVLGIGSLVVTFGLAQTAAGQIGARYDAVASTQVVVAPREVHTMSGSRAAANLPWDAPERVLRINGVEAAGLIAEVPTGEAAITAVPVVDPSAAAVVPPAVLAASGGLLDAVRGTISTGRFFDGGHSDRADRVVVLGANAAERLGVHRVDRQPAIFIGERPYTVIGILDETSRRSDLLDSVIMPIGTARADFALSSANELQVKITVGAGALVADQAPWVLDPNQPDAFEVQAPVSGSTMKDRVQGDVNAIFIALGAVALLVGGLGIANVTLLSVMERVGEIGLRRALGATRWHIGGQFLVESVVIGLLGGLIGASIGVGVVVGVAAASEWTPIVDISMVLAAAGLGGVIGLVAGVYPALKAATIEPIAALRGGV